MALWSEALTDPKASPHLAHYRELFYPEIHQGGAHALDTIHRDVMGHALPPDGV